MNNKLLQGIAKSALALSLTITSLTTMAADGITPRDIRFGMNEADFPVVFAPGRDLIEVNGPGNFGINAGDGASDSDDNSELVDVSSVFAAGFNFYGNVGNAGTNYSAVNQFNVSSNGHVTLGTNGSDSNDIMELDDFSDDLEPTHPVFITHSGDHGTDNTPSGVSPGGNSTGTDDIFYHLDAENNIVTITFDDTQHFEGNDTGDGLAAQLRFHDLGNGDFIVEHRYENIGWGFDRDDGEDDVIGWLARDRVNYDNNQKIAGYNTDSNIGHPGVYAWMFVNGVVVENNRILENSVAGTIIAPLVTTDPQGGAGGGDDPDVDVGDFQYILIDNAGGRFDLATVNGVTFVKVATGGEMLNVYNNETHDIDVKVTDTNGNEFTKTLTIDVIKKPEFILQGQLRAVVDEIYHLNIGTIVEQGTTPVITANGPSWLTITDNGDGTATLHGTPDEAGTFSVTATDVYGNQTTHYVTVDAEEVTATEGSGGAGSLDWLLLLIAGGLITRRK
jgi:hypothetical protein